MSRIALCLIDGKHPCGQESECVTVTSWPQEQWDGSLAGVHPYRRHKFHNPSQNSCLLRLKPYYLNGRHYSQLDDPFSCATSILLRRASDGLLITASIPAICARRVAALTSALGLLNKAKALPRVLSPAQIPLVSDSVMQVEEANYALKVLGLMRTNPPRRQGSSNTLRKTLPRDARQVSSEIQLLRMAFSSGSSKCSGQLIAQQRKVHFPRNPEVKAEYAV